MRTRLYSITEYLLEHRWRTVGLVLLVSFVPAIGLLGIIFAALVTLRKGMAEGALVVFATLPFFAYTYYTGSSEDHLPVLMRAFVCVAVISNFLTWVFAGMLRKQISWSQIVQIGALLGVLAISVVHLMVPDIISWWGVELTNLQRFLNEKMVATGMLENADLTEDQITSINLNKQSADGIVIGAMLFNTMLQLVAARWWQALTFNPGLLRRELHNIRLSSLAGVLFLLSLFFAFLGNIVVTDILPVLYILFGAAGLSLVHYLFSLMRPPSGFLWLVAMYVTLGLSLLMGWVMVWAVGLQIVAFLGLIDIWLDVRKRFKKS